jgi:hypothetical protein
MIEEISVKGYKCFKNVSLRVPTLRFLHCAHVFPVSLFR